jgi:23S rRNA (cytidine1920-2'-O)/16S rRNA (cytidine1409-2'-O)-methyltransferase
MNSNTEQTFVSRGGIKLQKALEEFGVEVTGKVVLDVGSSTGGFVDCLLQNSAAKVYALDTAYGELSWKLRNDPRVVPLERTNILHVETLPENVDLVTIDAGWTKLELVLPKVEKFLQTSGQIIALVKPHYEADKKQLQKGVLPKDVAEVVKDEVRKKIEFLGFSVMNECESPIVGGGGNTEYLFHISKSRSFEK